MTVGRGEGKEKSMMRIFTVFVSVFAILVAVHPATAQQAGKLYRIGFLTAASPVKAFQERMAAFRQGLRELGYVEGENIVIEERYGKGRFDRMPELAAELVALDVDVIVTHGGRWAKLADRTAKKAGRTIPMVFAVDANPVGRGIVDSLARPGGNITGLSDSHTDLVPKRLEFLKKVVPSATRVAVLWDPRRGALQLKALQAVAPALGVTILPFKFANPEDIEPAFAALRRERPDALNVLGYPLIATYRKRIADFALRNRLPAISTAERAAVGGFLMSYGVNFLDMYRAAATFVDKILKGAKPADLPVEQPTRFYLTVNLKTAEALGISFPRSILLRADKVIE
jgi:putative ABC transport system substrate-binding protein